jgi:hypothetical protein
LARRFIPKDFLNECEGAIVADKREEAPMAQTSAHISEVDKNFAAFQKLLPELLRSHPGQYAVMHDSKAIDFFDTLRDAVRFGRAKFGDHEFSIQEVTSESISLGYYSSYAFN